MSYLKKYFTEGLIQVAILLSLCGVRVDVGTHLPSWQEMILGPSSGLTQTQFHNLRNRLDGHGLHPKSVDLDEFFTARRLLGWVHSLDRLQVPGAELETWLVHRETEVIVGAPGQPSALQGPGPVVTDLGDQNEEGPPLRPGTVGVGSGSSSGSLQGNALREAMLTITRTQEEDGSDDVIAELEDPTDTPRPAGLDRFPDQAFEDDHPSRAQRTPLVSLDEDEGEEEELARVDWREEDLSYDHVNRELSEQYASLEAQTSVSLQECLQLLEDNFPFAQEPQILEEEDQDLREAALERLGPGREPLLSPLLTHEDPTLGLEQQWQDLLAVMEPEDMDVDSAVALSLPGSSTDDTMPSGTIQRSSVAEGHPSAVHQDVSLQQAFLPRDNQESYHLPLSPLTGGSDPQEPPYQLPQALLTLPNSSPHNLNISFQTHHLQDSSEENGTTGEPMTSDLFPEDSVLPSPLGSLLEDTTMFDEISLLDLALEEGFNLELASQLEEGFNTELASRPEEGFNPELASQLENELDSDSGLSLNFSHSPASPSCSEASYSSSSSSSSSFSSVSTAASSLSEDGAVGYNSDMEEVVDEEDDDDEEEGAVGGYSTDVRKICFMSYQDPEGFNHLPWLEHVGHDHTYNQQWSTSPSPGKTPRNLRSQHTKPYEPDVTDKMWSRDERRARALKIPFSNERIVNLPVEDFNTLLTKHHLTDSQLSLVRDIRRRGKNKMAAQNCRRRKLDVLLDLEQGVSALRRQRARLLKERTEGLRSVQEMKQRVSGLYQEVFSRLRDEDGRPLAAEEYSLQFGSDGRVLVTSGRQGSSSELPHRPSKKQKDRKK